MILSLKGSVDLDYAVILTDANFCNLFTVLIPRQTVAKRLCHKSLIVDLETIRE